MSYIVFQPFVCLPTFRVMRQRNALEVKNTPFRCLDLVSRYFWAGSQRAWEERRLVQAMAFWVKRVGEGERRSCESLTIISDSTVSVVLAAPSIATIRTYCSGYDQRF